MLQEYGLSPDDIRGEINFENLKKLLDTGKYSIDWWEGYESEKYGCINGYFIRMRNENSPIVDPSWGGTCVLLTDKGCPLTFEERPKGGRMLACKETPWDECICYYTKKDCADDWNKYYELLTKLCSHYRQKKGGI